MVKFREGLEMLSVMRIIISSFLHSLRVKGSWQWKSLKITGDNVSKVTRLPTLLRSLSTDLSVMYFWLRIRLSQYKEKESIEMNVKWSNWKIYFHLPYRPRSIHSIFSRLFLVNFRSTKRVNDWWNRWENGLENVYSGFNFHQTTDKNCTISSRLWQGCWI